MSWVQDIFQTTVSFLGLRLAVRGNKMLQTSDWKPLLSKPQLPVKDVYSTSRLPTMMRTNNQLWCRTFMCKTFIFQNLWSPLDTTAICQSVLVCFPTCRLGGFRSSRGTMSIRKSNWSNFVIAMAMSFLCKHDKGHKRLSDEVSLIMLIQYMQLPIYKHASRATVNSPEIATWEATVELK